MDWITGRLKEPTTYLALALAGVGLGFMFSYAYINMGRNYRRYLWYRS